VIAVSTAADLLVVALGHLAILATAGVTLFVAMRQERRQCDTHQEVQEIRRVLNGGTDE